MKSPLSFAPPLYHSICGRSISHYPPTITNKCRCCVPNKLKCSTRSCWCWTKTKLSLCIDRILLISKSLINITCIRWCLSWARDKRENTGEAKHTTTKKKTNKKKNEQHNTEQKNQSFCSQTFELLCTSFSVVFGTCFLINFVLIDNESLRYAWMKPAQVSRKKFPHEGGKCSSAEIVQPRGAHRHGVCHAARNFAMSERTFHVRDCAMRIYSSSNIPMPHNSRRIPWIFSNSDTFAGARFMLIALRVQHPSNLSNGSLGYARSVYYAMLSSL